MITLCMILLQVDKPLYDSGLMTPYDGNVYTYTKSLSYKVLELVPKQVLFNLIFYIILFAILVLAYIVEYLSHI